MAGSLMFVALTVWTFTFTVFVHSSSEANNSSTGLLTSRRDVLNHLLNGNDTDRYDPRVPPDYEEDHPTKVDIRIHLLSFDSVSETTMFPALHGSVLDCVNIE
ncbi:glycine receptor subunit alpha-2 [Plakobranchus ocellatus]|uniref:Glycine receptor subunit alpha-2 n=1 Tax=Plakobranchus ocellatus TaxID=259542 RepID=A0AAV3Y1W2_9GAST|nr:glycine receptor subunit alpha-2 [Plakobranchus ocellatus]